MALRVKLVRGMSGHPERDRETLRGLGLTRVGRERIVMDSPAVRGMIAKVPWALEVSETKEEFVKFGRRHRKHVQAEAAKKAAPAAKS